MDVEAVYRERRQQLFGIAWRILRSVEDAQDVAQEVFARLIEHRAEVTNPAAWLKRTAINLAIERSRRKRPAVPLPETPAVTAEPDLDRRALLDAALDHLPERQRVVFLLRHEEGMPLAEIAEALGVGVSTVGVHLTRALVALRRRLAPHIGDLT